MEMHGNKRWCIRNAGKKHCPRPMMWGQLKRKPEKKDKDTTSKYKKRERQRQQMS